MRRPTRAKRSKKPLAAAPMLGMRERFAKLTGGARKALDRRVRPLEKRAEALSVEARRMAAGYIHELTRMLTRLEKTVAPPAARKARGKAMKPTAHHAAPVELPRVRAASGEAAA